MLRNVLGSLIALAAAAVALWSPFLPWYAGREGSTYRVAELFSADGVTDSQAGLWDGLLLVMAVAALLALASVFTRLRLPAALAGLLVLGITVLWMVRQGQAADSLVISLGGDGVDIGALLALGAGVGLLLSASLIAGRGRHRRRRAVEEPAARPGPDESF